MSDNIEYEGKILDIDVDAVSKKIIALGGKAQKEAYFKRYVFDTVPAKQGEWLRLRTDGNETTLTYKKISSSQIDGTIEHEVVVSDFDNTLTILKNAGMSPKGYQENRREAYLLNGAELSIDYWPQLQPYLEIEAQNEEAVKEIARLLGFDANQLTGKNTEAIYADKGIDLKTIEDLRF
ncbi:hypothetical protein BH09PAT3_BH09PAT3_5820 [soil metagenome]